MAQVSVKGDLIVRNDGRIMTRSRARARKPSPSPTRITRTLAASTFNDPFVNGIHPSDNPHNMSDKENEWPAYNDAPLNQTRRTCFSSQTLSIGGQAATDEYPEPDQYTMVPAPLKILKVLIAELQASGSRDLDAADAAELAEEEEDDGDWEDEPNMFQNLTGGLTKQQLMAYAADDEPGAAGRQTDNETQAFLVEFFKAAATTQGFQDEWNALTGEEQARLRESAN